MSLEAPGATSGPRAARINGLVLTHRKHLASAPALVVQLLLLGVGGMVFWLLAARTATVEEVGAASQLFAVVLLIVYATNLGLPVVVARHGTAATEYAAQVYAWSVVLTTGSSLVGSVVAVLVLPSTTLGPLLGHGDLMAVALLFLATTGVSVATMMDNRQVGLGHNRAFLARNALMVLARLPLLAVAVPFDRGLWVWIAATMVALLSVLLTSLLTPVGPHRLDRVDRAGDLVSFGAVNYLSTLLSSAPFIILPLVVFASVDAADNAPFYIPWLAGTTLFLIPSLISRSLLIDASEVDATRKQQVRTALIACAAFGAVALLASVVVAPLFPLVYGDDYSESGAVLIGLCLALVPYGLTTTMLTIARVEADTLATLVISGLLTLFVLVPSAIWTPDGGTAGASVAWVAGHVACAVPAWLYLRRRQLETVTA